MRSSQILVAARYNNEPLPLKAFIYENGSQGYSSFKNLFPEKEISINKISSKKAGILPEMRSYYYVSYTTLYLCRYDTHNIETLRDFSSEIRFVEVFKPIEDVFNEKIQNCLLIITETEVIIYGIEVDSYNIISTEFSCKLASAATCLQINNGQIFIGGDDGFVYQAVYKTLDLFSYRYMTLNRLGGSLLKSLTSIFRKKQRKITAISVGKKFLVALSDKVDIFRIDSGVYKVDTIALDESYLGIQIIEENPLFFYCISSNGKRDFYSTKLLFSRDGPSFPDEFNAQKIFRSNQDMNVSIRKVYDKTMVQINRFNPNHLRNFTKFSPVENQETFPILDSVLDVKILDKIYILAESKIFIYEISDSKRFLMNCRNQEVSSMYNLFGDIEFMANYFELLSMNESIAKLEGLCKDAHAKNFALFVWMYRLLKPIWNVSPEKLRDNRHIQFAINKMNSLKPKIAYNFHEAAEFMDEFIQTGHYINLLFDYNVVFNESLEMILTTETDFKKYTLKNLLNLFSNNQAIEPLLKTMSNSCPLYLPLNQINLQRGLQLVKLEDKESLRKSLQYLENAKFDQTIIDTFNEIGFYYGSVYLIKKLFDFEYAYAVDLFKSSVKCKCSFELAMSDTREDFLYPFFDALIELGSPTFKGSLSACCEEGDDFTFNLLMIKNPLFEKFLRYSFNSVPHKIIYWKYCLIRDKKEQAIQTLLSLINDTSSMDTIQSYLDKALTVSIGTSYHGEIKLKIKLFKIQRELFERDSKFKRTSLLDSETLYNDYLIDHPDLGLMVLDAVGFKDMNVLKEQYQKLFKQKSLREACLAFNDISQKHFDMILEIMIELKCDDVCLYLELCGFKPDIINKNITSYVNEKVGNPSVKSSLLANLKDYMMCKQKGDPKNISNYKIKA